ncbi:hypothetical protein B6U99_03245 [Candidatus Geothermarchaeota archaeon ex4572_27]|nr:MAG: hypothetical protein B6U99_03245 [Candidatus Geothermarchaeota archaeon ex4572_27]
MRMAIRVEGLRKSYGAVEALRGVSFEVQRCECAAYLGPDGAGKTTTVRILLGLLKPDSGLVEVLGCEVSEKPEGIRGRVGYVQQGPSFEPGLTVRENLELYGYLWGIPREELRRRVADIAAALGLEGCLGMRPEELSIGMRRLLQVARELLHTPELLLLDEPTTGLDPLARRRVLDYIREWSRDNGVTVLMSSHVPQDVERLCSRVILLRRGRVAADMPIDEFRRRFGGLSRVVIELDRSPAVLAGRMRDLAAVVEVSGTRITCYLDSGGVVSVIDAALSEASRKGLRVVDIKVEEPTLGDALVKAYVGGGA